MRVGREVRGATPRVSPVLVAAAWMVGAIVSFVAMMVAIRELKSAGISVFEILTFRSLLALLILAPLVPIRGGRAFATQRLGLHVVRNVVHFGGQAGWVYGITLLPLATVSALEFTTPLWVAVLAVLFLGERMTRHRAVATALGVAGALVILRPGIAVIDWAALVVLACTLLYAISNIMVKPLTRTESALVIVFYMQVIQLPLGLAFAFFDWTQPAWTDAPWFVVVGVTALTSHYCLARALKLADATIVFPMEFLRLPGSALAGYILYGERIEALVGVGAAIMFAGNYYSVWRETRRSRG
jgi:drug/metabolite transporter (DMT)-like permease